jgi:diadenosine tetraphosphate (Ap4A) HIT family hydrolase
VVETPEEFWERARVGARVPPVEDWVTWPFDGELRVRELQKPADEEKVRSGRGGVDCDACERGDKDAVWSDDNWWLRPLGAPSGLPIVLLLETRAHLDFHELTADLQAGLGPLMVRIERAVAAVEGVGRVHIGRWGEGSEHFHLWFMGRPARMRQLSDSFAAIWDDVLPPLPEDVWRANLEAVCDHLADGR